MITAFHLPFYTPIWVAERLGAFRDEGLSVSIHTPAPGQSPAALERGEADVSLGGVMRSFILADQPDPRYLIAIAEVNSRDGFFILSRSPADNFQWQDLIGRRLALFSLAPTPWMCLQGVLRREGVDPASITTVADLGVAEGIAALLDGHVDFLQTSQPMAAELVEQGQAFLARAQALDVGHVPYSSLIVTEAFRSERPETCAAVVRATARALRWMATQPSDVIADLVASEFPEIPSSRLRTIISVYQTADTWADGPRQDRAAFERLGQYLVAGGLIGQAASYEALVDDSFSAIA
ncbi:MAG: ABC transporter substrate-binding protein [Chloroflexota bacterium]